MPLAPAHPAAVLPLRWLRLPTSAMVVGSVSPDAPVYLPVGVEYATSHSLRGLPVVTVIGLSVLWIWSVLVRDAVVDATPYLRHRLPARTRLDRRAWLLAPVAVALGAATHVLWDSTTHDWGFVVHGVGILDDDLGPLPIYRWLQDTSTVLGSLIVGGYGARLLRQRAATPRPPVTGRPALFWAVLGVTALVAAVALRDPEQVVGVLLVATACLGAVRTARVAEAGSAR